MYVCHSNVQDFKSTHSLFSDQISSWEIRASSSCVSHTYVHIYFLQQLARHMRSEHEFIWTNSCLKGKYYADSTLYAQLTACFSLASDVWKQLSVIIYMTTMCESNNHSGMWTRTMHINTYVHQIYNKTCVASFRSSSSSSLCIRKSNENTLNIINKFSQDAEMYQISKTYHYLN